MKKTFALLMISAFAAALASGCVSPKPAITGENASPASATEAPTEAVTDTPEQTELPRLSRMTEEECTKTLRAIVPELPEEMPFDLMDLVRRFEEDIDMPYWSDVYFTPEHNAFERVRSAVKGYYGGEMPDDTALLPSTVPDPPADHQYMWLVFDGSMVLPYKEFACSTTYIEPDGVNEGGMLHADGMAFFAGIISHRDEFPEVGRDFEIMLYDSCYISTINVCDAETQERLKSNIRRDELDETISAADRDLIVEMIVGRTGRYIEALDENEHDAYIFGFIVKNGD